MPEGFDLVVVGTGMAAATVARACREAGRSVAVADCRPSGGTCANRGCDPFKRTFADPVPAAMVA